jgi:hypothetical protein
MAATSKDVMLAVLAMDAYNEGYSPGMTVNYTTSAGGAKVIAQAGGADDQAVSFYADAYNWNGETIIAYRGTRINNSSGLPDLGDMLYGWTATFGFSQASQAQLAINFYDQVQDLLGDQGSNANIVLTGHSLGGALAGFVADLTGDQADIFDNMTFGDAVRDEIAFENESLEEEGGSGNIPDPSSSTNVTQFTALNEVAELERETSADSLDFTLSPLSATYSSFTSIGANPITLHSQALLVLLTYADANNLTDWESIGQPLYDAEFDDSNAAQDLGITNAVIQGWYIPAQAALSAVAYSTAPGGSPFGSTATQSYFADADTLGKLASNNQLTSYLSSSQAQDDLVEILVQYAEDQAWTAGQNGGSDGQADGAGDFVANGGTLTINLDPQKWVTTFQQQAPTIVGLSDVASTIVGEDGFAYLLGGVYSSLEQVSNDLTSAIEDNTITQISAGVGDLGGILDGERSQWRVRRQFSNRRKRARLTARRPAPESLDKRRLAYS